MDNNLIELINRIDNHLLMIQDEIRHYCEIPERMIEFNKTSCLSEWDFDELIWLFRSLRSMLEDA
jgi:hypothetical protein